MTPSLGIKHGPHLWEASALTTMPPLLYDLIDFDILIGPEPP